uniref:RanBD1 domain-containing protein n=1 Tax=Myotis lucifugus TaxID=59463 RepID=G1QCU7_MYOLU
HCSPVKRDRRSSFTQPGERISGFPLRSPTLIHGQAPRAGLQARSQGAAAEPASGEGLQPHRKGPLRASQQQHQRARPLQVPPLPGSQPGLPAPPNGDQETRRQHLKREIPRNESSNTSEEDNEKEQVAQQESVFGQNLKDKLINNNTEAAHRENAEHPSQKPIRDQLFPISSSLENSTNRAEATCNAFVFGQKVSEHVGPTKLNAVTSDTTRENSCASQGLSATSRRPPEKESWTNQQLPTPRQRKTSVAGKSGNDHQEETESNTLQIRCKLFVFGQGLLRPNDVASTGDWTLQSQLVRRTRLIINTKLWAQMQIDKASEKSICFMAMHREDQGVDFLISASSMDAGRLCMWPSAARTPAPSLVQPHSMGMTVTTMTLAPKGAIGGCTDYEGDRQTEGQE